MRTRTQIPSNAEALRRVSVEEEEMVDLWPLWCWEEGDKHIRTELRCLWVDGNEGLVR